MRGYTLMPTYHKPRNALYDPSSMSDSIRHTGDSTFFKGGIKKQLIAIKVDQNLIGSIHEKELIKIKLEVDIIILWLLSRIFACYHIACYCAVC